MNRLVIIGNGFDLAHGLPTGYCDFIDWYWNAIISKFSDLKNKFYEDDFIKVHLRLKQSSWYSAINDLKKTKNYNHFKNFIGKYSETYNPIYPEENFNRSYLQFKNTFFSKICDTRAIINWVDIENEYYKLLKECLNEQDSNEKVKRLNEEFEQVKKLLEQYLIEEVEEKFIIDINTEIIDILSTYKYVGKEINEFFKELQTSDANAINSAFQQQYRGVGNEKNFYINKTFLLSFNYTSLTMKYYEYSGLGNRIIKNIHGNLNDRYNKIIFGFGDEMDDYYKAIEKKDDNKYLTNIKSFAYLNTPNYKETIDFLESDKFQVYIMGHSCGLSDRILLNKIFEHKNCCSIKIYYYQDEDKDNYTDIAQNISRHFNKKEIMRERIVNKTLCKPLPQIKLPKK